MNNQEYIEKFKTLEEYVRYQVNCNKGSESPVMKSELVDFAISHGVEADIKHMTKDDIFIALKDKVTMEEIISKFHLGVKSYLFQQKFDITHEEVKRMARLGFIEITGSERFRAYGKDCYADLYNALDYFRLTPEEVKKWLIANPKGTRKAQKV